MAETPAKKRRRRPSTINFKAEELVKSWEEWTNLRDPGFHWDGSGYGKSCRSSGCDQEGINMYEKPLKVLLKLAPSAFPSHPDLRRTFVILNQRFHVLQVSQRQEEKAASEAADKWRIMCKDVYNASKKKNKEDYGKAMTELIALLHPGPDEDDEEVDTVDTVAEASTAVAENKNECSTQYLPEFPNFDELDKEVSESTANEGALASCATCSTVESGSDVEIVKEVCNCPACKAKESEVPPVPNAAIGGQRLQTRTTTQRRGRPATKAKHTPAEGVKPRAKGRPKASPNKKKEDGPKINAKDGAEDRPTTRKQKPKDGPKINAQDGATKQPKPRMALRKRPMMRRPLSTSLPKTKIAKGATKPDDIIKKPTKIVNLQSGKHIAEKTKEAWIKEPSKDGCYVAGQTEVQSPNFEKNIQTLQALITSNDIKTKTAARQWIDTHK
jgi:hypothetical protein